MDFARRCPLPVDEKLEPLIEEVVAKEPQRPRCSRFVTTLSRRIYCRFAAFGGATGGGSSGDVYVADGALVAVGGDACGGAAIIEAAGIDGAEGAFFSILTPPNTARRSAVRTRTTTTDL